MQTQPPEDWLSRAEMRRAEAIRLLAAGRSRDALDLLNSAIQLAPHHAPLFLARAEVFERLGMLPQAAGDRRQFQDLSARFGEAEPALDEEPEIEPLPESPQETGAALVEPQEPEAEPLPESEQEAAPEPPAAMPGPAIPPPVIPLPAASGATTAPAGPPAEARAAPVRGAPAAARPARSPATVFAGLLVSLVVIAIAGSATVLAVLSLFGKEDVVPGINGDDNTSVAVSPTPAASEAAPVANVEGSPFGLSEVQKSWTARGLSVKAGEDVSGFSGFAVKPTPLTLTRGSDSLDVALLVYRDASSPRQDWSLPAGGRPSPAAGRSLPSHTSIWWNQNTVVVVLSGDAALSSDAFNAYIDLSP